MPNFVYTTNIPFASHNPSADQPIMQVNTNSIDEILAVDHYSFNTGNGGYHKTIRQVFVASDPVAIPGLGQYYSKVLNGIVNPFYLSPGGVKYNIVNKSNNGTWSLSGVTPYTIPDIIPDNCFGFLGLGGAFNIMASVPFMIINGQQFAGTFSIQYTVAFIGSPGSFQLQIAKNGMQPDVPNSEYRFIYWPVS